MLEAAKLSTVERRIPGVRGSSVADDTPQTSSERGAINGSISVALGGQVLKAQLKRRCANDFLIVQASTS